MKKRFLFGLMAIILAGLGLGGVSLAEGEVAQIGETQYATLSDAISAVAVGETINLIGDVDFTDNSTLNITKNITLDLMGHTISKSYSHTNYIFDVKQNTTFKIQDTVGGGKILRSNGMTAIRVLGTLNIEGGRIESKDGVNGYTIAIKCDEDGIGKPGTVIINSGEVVGDQAIQSRGVVTINGGSFEGDINAWSHTAWNPGKVIINGGTINGNVSSIQWLPVDSSAITEINGGTFVGGINELYNTDGSPDPLQTIPATEIPENTAEAKVVITGGTFSEDPSEYLAEGYVAVSDGAGAYVVGIAKYTITWNFKTAAGADTSDTTEVNHGDTPSHDNPDSYTSNNRTYTFASWTPTIVVATEDTGYTATYDEGGCVAGYVVISGSCVNKQTVACTMPSSTVANATYATTTEITYNGSAWTEAGECTFTCNAGYRLSNGQCVKKTNSSSSSSSSSSSNKTGNNNTGATAETGTTNTGVNTPTVDPQAVAANGYTNEMNEAYEFAYKNGITTMKSVNDADMFGGLNRIAMAKMLSQYAINILGKKPDTTRTPNFSDVSDSLDKEYDNGVTLAYQLGIMGINIDDFRPYDEVPRAEFVTALSRLLFGLADGTNEYYSTHMAKLKKEGIISVADPDMLELRGYVMLMLMRSAK